jgi:hypothetical protein
MATDRDQWADNLSGDSGGWLTGFLAEEEEFDRRSLWRLGSWGVGSVAAVIVALLANHSSVGWRREQTASADLVRQSQQIQWVAKESQNETRRLASAVDTLNSDRDRLYARVTVLEQGLDSVTGSIVRQSTAASPTATPSTPSASSPTTAASGAAAPSAPQTAADPTTASLVGPPAPAAAAPSTVSQGGPPPAPATSAITTAATPDKATADKPGTDRPSTVVALQPDPAAAASVLSPPAPTASVARQEATNNASASAITAPGMTPTAPLMPAKSFMAPPDPAAATLTAPDPSTNASALPPLPPPQTIAAVPGMTEPDAAESHAPAAIAVQRTEFGVDLGGANSIDGLRALWRGLLKYRSNKALAELRPIIVVKERSNGLGMQLRLVAGPISDAAAAARICATLTESDRSCEPSVFDGQRLAINGDNSTPTPAPAAISNGHPATASTRSSRKRAGSKGAKTEEPAAKPEPAKPSLTSFLGLR